ncbi:hypothetical protein [Caldicellulosiruptor morganii]|uniref:Uncharacterized protein n=1 Tax=Caldicellulosiruptor morganii TaxID=1387555 RepID=A0ABY7BKH7_9FIRM|nr:hypothetical protein [Caldicellulosiruptor morganii]WAM33342.1 hypothetical protein OTK00_001837 [Caldicellulosiruptor morganii]
MNTVQEQQESDMFELAPDIYELILPDTFHEEADYIYLGAENYCRVYVLDIDYPSEMYVGFLTVFLTKAR